MKKFIYLTAIISAFVFISPAEAQINVSINIGSQPQWGPVGYDYARYYYMPEVDVYYDVVNRRYTYYQGNRWVTKSRLPGRYKHVDLYRTYKVVINSSSPWRQHRNHRNDYGRYAGDRNQHIIRDHGSRVSKHRKGPSHKAVAHKSKGKDRGHKKHDRDHGHGRGR